MPSDKAHFGRIDALRGVAIFAVFLFHYWLAVNQRDPDFARAAALPPAVAPILGLHALGFLGVQLFFVISGFCIHHSYLSWRARNPTAPTRRFFPGFYHRRFWRIVPPYLIALFVVYFAKTARPFSFDSVVGLLPHVALANTLSPTEFFGINPSFWSVAVEWQLYLAYPLILWLFLRFGGVGGFVCATAISAAFQFLMPRLGAPFFIQNLPFRWWYDWSIGALVATSWAERRPLFPEGRVFGVVFAIATYIAVVQPEFNSVRWAAPPLFFAYWVETSVFSTRPMGRFMGALAVLGLCSYSFYLWHQPLTHLAISFAAAKLHHPGPVTIWLGVCGALLVLFGLWSYVAYRWIETGSIRAGNWVWETLRQRRRQSDLGLRDVAPVESGVLNPLVVKSE